LRMSANMASHMHMASSIVSV